VESFYSLQGKEPAHAGRLEAIPLDPAALVKFQGQIGPDFRLLVNASSAGMLPHSETNAWPDEVPFAQGTFVYDLVYKPPETALMQAAHRSGLRASNGLGMLVEQAALSLERWTGRTVPREVMWQVIETSHGMADPPPSPINEEDS
jgi:shikimate dehydrogenase